MEKIIRLDKLKDAIESQIDNLYANLTERESKKLTKTIEEINFVYEVVKNCTEIIIEVVDQLQEDSEEIAKSVELSQSDNLYYNNVEVLGKLLDSVKEDYSSVDLKTKVIECLHLELNKRYDL